MCQLAERRCYFNIILNIFDHILKLNQLSNSILRFGACKVSAEGVGRSIYIIDSETVLAISKYSKQTSVARLTREGRP